jgi:hypothetical protein
MTLPLFITGPGLLGDVWRKNFGTGLVAGNYASMAQFFRLFYEGNGVIGYLHSDDNYIKLLRVYDEYSSELERYGGSSGGGGGGRLAHYTILWSRGILWRD